ncbi:MAG: hypothetical protein AVDCRST_MAG26-2916, partial [uncultured Chloroflexia bacterium]
RMSRCPRHACGHWSARGSRKSKPPRPGASVRSQMPGHQP